MTQNENNLNYSNQDDLLTEFISARFQRNLEVFLKYLPHIGKKFENYFPQSEICIFCSGNNGIPNARIGDSQFPVYSTENPIEYCKQQVISFLKTNVIKQIFTDKAYDPYGQIHYKYNNAVAAIITSEKRESIKLADLDSVPVLVMSGIGLGYQLGELFERLDIQNLIIVEPDLDMFYLSLHCFDWANLINYIVDNNHGIDFILGDNSKDFELSLKRYFTRHGVFLSGTEIIYNHLTSKKYLELTAIIRDNYRFLHRGLGFFDDHLFATSHAVKAITERKHFVNKKILNKDVADLPVFVIGSGPSLDNDISFLRKYQDKAIIIACGTAIDALYHAGIKPDFYANTERVPNIKEVLGVIPDNKFFDDIILLTGDVCHPYTTAFFENTAIFSKPDEPTFTYLSGFFEETEKIQEIQFTNPLVGNMGVSGAVYLGFKKIYLFGLDNGKKIGGNNLHSKFTSLYHERGVQATNENYNTDKQVAANFGGTCNSGDYYEISARYIGETLINNAVIDTSNIKCFNCSDGVYINNTIPAHSEDLFVFFEKLPDIDKSQIKNYLIKDKTTELNIKIRDIEKLFDNSRFTEICNEINEHLNSTLHTRSECVNCIQEISEALHDMSLEKNDCYYALCLEGSLQAFFIGLNRVLYGYRDPSKCLEKFKSVRDIVCDFLTEAPLLFEHLPHYIMGEHRKYYKDGKVGIDMPHCKAPLFPEERKLVTREYDDPVKKFVKRYS